MSRFCEDGRSYTPAIIDIDLRYAADGLTWELGELQDAIKNWSVAMFRHLDVQTIADESQSMPKLFLNVFQQTSIRILNHDTSF